MPYDPIRDSSSSGPATTPNGGLYVSPSSAYRPLSSGSGDPQTTPRGSFPPAFNSSTSDESRPRSPLSAGPSFSGSPGGESEGSQLAERRGAPQPSKRLSLSALLNDNNRDQDIHHLEHAGRPSLSPQSAGRPGSGPSALPSSSGSTSTRTSPNEPHLSLPNPSTYPPPPSLGPRRMSNTSEPSGESSQPVQFPALAPPGFTHADATVGPSDTSFVMDAVNPALKRKRDSLVATEPSASQRRKSSTASLASRSSSGRNGSIGEAPSTPSRPDELKRKLSSTGSSTASQPTQPGHSNSLPQAHPRPSVLAQSLPGESSVSSPPTAASSSSQPALPPTSTYLPPSHLPPRPPPQSNHPTYPPQPSTSATRPPPLAAVPANAQAAMQPPPADPSAPRRLAYAPRNRTSVPRSVLTPMPWAEYTQLRDHPELGSKNPMRGQGPRPPKVAKVTVPPPPSHASAQARPPPPSSNTNGGAQYQTNAVASSSSRPSSSSGVEGGGAGAVGGANKEEADDDYRPMSPTAEIPQKRSASGFEDPSSQRRRIDGAGGFVNADVAKVASHYNMRPEVGLQDRNLSPIIGLKNFNNWVKSVLIGKFTRLDRPPLHRRDPPSGVVLDLGCGKGGDLKKWGIARVQHYMAFDIAEVSVQQARQRALEYRNCPFSFEFYQLDCFGESIATIIPEQRLLQYPIDTVTMQFCMHYAFETESKARQMLDNVSRYLRPGGTFVGTIPNAQKLVDNLMVVPEPEGGDEAEGGEGKRYAFGNEVYEIAFEGRDEFPMYGHRYSFFLNDAVEDVPEYLVHWDNFESLAAEYGLSLVYKREFHEVFEEEREGEEYGPLLTRMKVMNDKGESEMTEDQFEAANIYLAFAFQKQ